MLEAFGQALTVVFDPVSLLLLTTGVILGILVGLILGIGSITMMVILIPFVFAMRDPSQAVILFTGIIAVHVTADTFISVLFGIPGSSGSQATVLDGHPLARRGEAGYALATSFIASGVGGIIGAIVLLVFLPILKPIVLSFQSPEIFALTVFGVLMVVALSQGAVKKGLMMGCLGLLLTTIGYAPRSGVERFTFGIPYLMQGMPKMPAIMGLFAFPELFNLVLRGVPIAGKEAKTALSKDDLKRSFISSMKNWSLILRCGLVGTIVGIIPGLGNTVVDWIAYTVGRATCKGGRESFGTGDIRGVISAESANNAKVGGSLLTTVVFGIPGSLAMVMFLMVFLMMDVHPGPELLTTKLYIPLTMVLAIVIANILGSVICTALSQQLARITTVPINFLVPIVTTLVFIGAFQKNRDFGDLVFLLAFALIGWLAKLFGWPRPPLVIGLVLGHICEYRFVTTLSAYEGLTWLFRPAVIIIFIILVLVFMGSALLTRGDSKAKDAGGEKENLQADVKKKQIDPEWPFTVIMLAVGGVALILSFGWPFGAAAMPWLVGFPLFFLGVIQLFMNVFASPKKTKVRILDIGLGLEDPIQVIARQSVRLFSWIIGLFFGIWLFGFFVSIPVFIFSYLRWKGGYGWKVSVLISAIVSGCCFGIYETVLHVPWPEGIIFETIRLSPWLAG